MLKPKFGLDEMTTLDDVKKVIKFQLDDMFCFGETSGERAACYMSAKNPDDKIEKATQKILEKIEQYFLDNR